MFGGGCADVLAHGPRLARGYDIISVEHLRAAAERASAYAGEPGRVVPLSPGQRTRTDGVGG
jgi:hypothetical protein